MNHNQLPGHRVQRRMQAGACEEFGLLVRARRDYGTGYTRNYITGVLRGDKKYPFDHLLRQGVQGGGDSST